MKLPLEHLPPSLQSRRETPARCLEAMNCALPPRRAVLPVAHARGATRPDSDLDLCGAADRVGRPLEAARRSRVSLRTMWPCHAFTLPPIKPGLPSGNQARRHKFFTPGLQEGALLATQD